MPLIGKKKHLVNTTEEAAERRAEQQSQWISEIYVNRRKVGEFRAPTEQEAQSKAAQKRSEYPGARAHIVTREAPRSRQHA